MLPTTAAAQGLIQPGFKHCQGWIIHSFSGQFVPLSHSKAFLPKILSKAPLFHIPSCPITTILNDELLSGFPIGSRTGLLIKRTTATHHVPETLNHPHSRSSFGIRYVWIPSQFHHYQLPILGLKSPFINCAGCFRLNTIPSFGFLHLLHWVGPVSFHCDPPDAIYSPRQRYTGTAPLPQPGAVTP